MGKPTGYRDDPDAVSMHTTPEGAYRDDFADDVPDISPAPPPDYNDAAQDETVNEEPDSANNDNEHAYFLSNGTTPPETHFESTSYHIFAKRTRIANEVIPVQDQRSDADPDFLNSWVRSMAERPPSPYIHIMGSHRETKRGREKSGTADITDFRILVSLQNYLWPNFVGYGPNESKLITAENGEKTNRGTILKKRAPGVNGNIEVGNTKPELNEWCHRYCANSKSTRVFRLTRTVTGLNEEKLRSKLENIIRQTNYKGKITIEFPVSDRAVDIYSTSTLNNWRTTNWIRWLFYLTFLWIFSWPVLFFTTKRYNVVRVEWPFSQVDAQGRRKYTTVTEEQWADKFGPAIQRLCLDHYQGMTGNSHLSQLLARSDANEPLAVEFRNVQGAVNAAASAFSGGPKNAINQVSNLMRFASGSNDRIGWGFDT